VCRPATRLPASRGACDRVPKSGVTILPLGEATKEVEYDKPPLQTLGDLQSALSKIGQVSGVDEQEMTVQGTSRYGLQKVRMRLIVTPNGNGSKITAVSLSDDVWAAGAKNCNRRLFEALQNLNNPNYVPSQGGMSLLRLILSFVAFVVVLLFILTALPYLPSWVTATVIGLGLVAIMYFTVAKARFGKK
jgi:hypothetical protein